MPREQRVFLSYAREDHDTVKTLYDDLKKREVNVWFDQVDLKKGSWKKQIRKAIAQSTDFLICISEAALRKTGDEPGFQDEELDYAYEIAQQQSVQDFTIIPVRLENCERGDHRLSVYQQYDLFKDWDGVLDRLAIQLGGYSLADRQTIDERTEDEKMIKRLQNRALASYFAGEQEKAIRTLDVVEDQENVVLGTVSVQTLVNKGGMLMQLQRHDEAEAIFKKTLALYPDNVQALCNRGVMLGQLRRYHEALGVFEKALSVSPHNIIALSNKGTTLGLLQRHHEALRTFEKALAIDSENVLVWHNKGETLKRLGRNEQALNAYDKASTINPNYAQAWYSRGVVLGLLQRNEDALEAFEKTIALDPGNADAWYNKGAALGNLKRHDEAIESFDMALTIKPHDTHAVQGKKNAMKKLGHSD